MTEEPRGVAVVLAFTVSLVLWVGLITLGWLVYRMVRWGCETLAR